MTDTTKMSEEDDNFTLTYLDPIIDDLWGPESEIPNWSDEILDERFRTLFFIMLWDTYNNHMSREIFRMMEFLNIHIQEIKSDLGDYLFEHAKAAFKTEAIPCIGRKFYNYMIKMVAESYRRGRCPTTKSIEIPHISYNWNMYYVPYKEKETKE